VNKIDKKVLFIDSREPASVQKKVNKIGLEYGFVTETKYMDIGDYVFEDREIAIERKTTVDFINSVRDGRINSQLNNLEQYSNPYLFISGSFKSLQFVPYVNGWTTSHTVGALCSIVTRYNVKVLQFDTLTQLIHAIFIIYEKTSQDRKIDLHVTKKKYEAFDPNFVIYRSLPGCGEKRANALLELYPQFSGLLKDVKEEKVKTKLPKETLEFLSKL
jgi:ERCC4-type nuclease